MIRARRIGVFGGAFDPPHVAHVALARAALDQLQLDELRILPTGNAWHRAVQPSAAVHRLAMARLAFADVARAVVDERELHRAGPTYTVDTLRELGAEYPGAELFVVIGEDQARTLTRWHDWQALVSLAVICVAARPPATAEPAVDLPPGTRSRPLIVPPMPESATGIRALVRAGGDIRALVPGGVARYIETHHLYRSA